MRDVTAGSDGWSMDCPVAQINADQRGWLGSFALAATFRVAARVVGCATGNGPACGTTGSGSVPANPSGGIAAARRGPLPAGSTRARAFVPGAYVRVARNGLIQTWIGREGELRRRRAEVAPAVSAAR